MARPIDRAHHEDLALRAFEAVRARGVTGLSMSAIAADIGVKRSTLYWYFKGIADIFDAVLEITLERQAAFVAEQVLARDHPIDQLAAWVRGVQLFFDHDPELLPVLVQLWAVGRPDEPERVLERARERLASMRTDAVAALVDAIAAGQVNDCDAGGVIDLCMVVIDGCLVHRVARGLDPGPVLDLFFASTLEPLRACACDVPQGDLT